MINLPTYENYIKNLDENIGDDVDISYSLYCSIIENHLNEGFLGDLKDKAVQLAVKILGPIKDYIQKISEDLKVGILKVIEAFKQKSVFEFLKSIKFNLRIVLKSFNELTSLIRNGLFKVFEKISKTGVFKKLRDGAIKIDEFLDQYPLIKKIGGLAVAAILIYMWLNMTFIGDLEYDFNWNDIIMAIAGKFSITDLFFSPSGLMLMTLFVTGPYISVPWLGSSIYNLCIALFYTGYVKLRDSEVGVLTKIKNMVK
jgi:hypothetical protein